MANIIIGLAVWPGTQENRMYIGQLSLVANVLVPEAVLINQDPGSNFCCSSIMQNGSNLKLVSGTVSGTRHRAHGNTANFRA